MLEIVFAGIQHATQKAKYQSSGICTQVSMGFLEPASVPKQSLQAIHVDLSIAGGQRRFSLPRRVAILVFASIMEASERVAVLLSIRTCHAGILLCSPASQFNL